MDLLDIRGLDFCPLSLNIEHLATYHSVGPGGARKQPDHFYQSPHILNVTCGDQVEGQGEQRVTRQQGNCFPIHSV